MDRRNIYLTDFDAERLNRLLADTAKLNPMDQRHILELRDEVKRADIVPSREIPNDVVTMNSKVRVEDLNSGEKSDFTLVFPRDADIGSGRISILAPVGTALLGYREGDIIEWKVREETRKLKVDKILYQPEAEGNYSL